METGFSLQSKKNKQTKKQLQFKLHLIYLTFKRDIVIVTYKVIITHF